MTIAPLDNPPPLTRDKLPAEADAFLRKLIETFRMFVDTWPATSAPVIGDMLKSLERVIVKNADAFDDAAKAKLQACVDSTAFNILNALDNENDE